MGLTQHLDLAHPTMGLAQPTTWISGLAHSTTTGPARLGLDRPDPGSNRKGWLLLNLPLAGNTDTVSGGGMLDQTRLAIYPLMPMSQHASPVMTLSWRQRWSKLVVTKWLTPEASILLSAGLVSYINLCVWNNKVIHACKYRHISPSRRY